MLGTILMEVRDERTIWRAALQEQQQRDPPAIAWLAYRQGGVDALEKLAARVTVDL
ncbi:MAG: hypothetical protein HC822_10040 [Oscillochloris sp.]|nr:hypothetical protein [Oscillochloris sp.]